MPSFSDIKTRDDFFKLLNIPKQHMTYLLYNKEKKGTENSYYTFELEKKSGGVRIINTPNDELKFVQKQLTSLLWKAQKNIWNNSSLHPNISHAFQKEKSIITNAQIHRNKRFVLNIDLENFFNSFHFGRVKGFFEKDKNFKVPPDVALIIAQLTCYQGVLPQGAPSSPIITNLICRILDLRILKLAKKYKLDYSRYADDLTFSTNIRSFDAQEKEFLSVLETEIKRAGFKINTKKTRLQFNNSRQEVTGLIVNKKINVPKEYYRNTRAMANSLYKNEKFFINNEWGTINQLEGRFAFINQLDKFNNSLEYNSSLRKNSIEYQKSLLSTQLKENSNHNMLLLLNAREKEYQKFLFYKYFYANQKPTIVTEGKTDIRYLKAALKSLYKDYPEMIEKKGTKYIFKVSFFKRSKRFRYFFNFSLDGADSMKNLHNFFSDNNNKLYPNYWQYFDALNSSSSVNPIFFIFDNELSNKNKPLRNFVNHVCSVEKENADAQLKLLKEKLNLQLKDNLYLLTNQLLDGFTENEMEDLFDAKTLKHIIKGKTFSKNGDNKDHYGKEIFSKYILDNYTKINFENFRLILDNMNEIIHDYSPN
ncbi:DNA polymerase [Listeria weihenstephanensis]|uniref:RNA-directed DNA polymerase n=1 Tax=Listeria weihenstephanensis TaxID=1006155 RepID=A0A1S7FVX7_9LIST|nr:retron Ec67 family RNA-directed DNA polymerase/endonuclease [Listeria weihenstephanensis]AQY51614.1 DNA polymerase [Listeria weihenstephanensis]